MQDENPILVEDHQADISQPTYVITPYTPKAERMVGMINKNLLAFLWHMLLEQVLLNNFIKDLIKKSCETLVDAKQSTCKWNSTTGALTMAEEAKREAETKAFKSATRIKDKIGLLEGGLRKQKNCTLPEALFNLDSTLVKTIHDRNQAPPETPRMPPKANKHQQTKRNVMSLT
jgi:hypothetical protein